MPKISFWNIVHLCSADKYTYLIEIHSKRKVAVQMAAPINHTMLAMPCLLSSSTLSGWVFLPISLTFIQYLVY